jgi:hypothetical protein
MTDHKTHSILFELQKNLEDLSSAKMQMEEFRSSSKSVVQGIGNVQEKFIKHLTDLETDYKQRVNKLEESLTTFLASNKEENNNTIQKVASLSEKEISKGVEQFSTVASKVETSNNEKIFAISKLLEAIEKDYHSKLNQLHEAISLFIASQKEENKLIILDVVSTSKEAIHKGVEQFSNVADKVEEANNKNIITISKLLEHYKSVVEASRSLIDTLNAIDFPSKLDALSSKTQLIIESITNAKQALELKSNETQTSIIDKTTTAKEQIIKNTDAKFQSLTEHISYSKENFLKTVIDKLSELATQSKAKFDNLNNSLNEKSAHLNRRQVIQEKEIKLLKMIAMAITAISVIGTIVTILVLKKH